MHRKIITREELYDLVWQKPTQQLAKELQVSDSAIGKWCKTMEVPKPPRGFWARAKESYQVTKAPLKALSKNGKPKITVQLTSQKSSAPRSPEKPELIAIVPGSLRSPHEMVKITKAAFKQIRPNQHGMLESKQSKTLDMRVSPSNLDRALLFFDSLLKTLNKMGFNVLFEKDWQGEKTVVKFLESSIQIRIFETSIRSENNEPKTSRHFYEKYIYTPSGKLSFQIRNAYFGCRNSWSDGVSKKFESYLNSIITEFKRFNELKKLADIEREKWHKEYERQQLEKERLRLEREKEKQLLELAIQWDSFDKLDRFLDKIEEAYPDDPRSAEFVNWGRMIARRNDPIFKVKQLFESDD